MNAQPYTSPTLRDATGGRAKFLRGTTRWDQTPMPPDSYVELFPILVVTASNLPADLCTSRRRGTAANAVCKSIVERSLRLNQGPMVSLSFSPVCFMCRVARRIGGHLDVPAVYAVDFYGCGRGCANSLRPIEAIVSGRDGYVDPVHSGGPIQSSDSANRAIPAPESDAEL